MNEEWSPKIIIILGVVAVLLAHLFIQSYALPDPEIIAPGPYPMESAQQGDPA